MFENPGAKIKSLAKAVMVVVIICSIIAVIVYFNAECKQTYSYGRYSSSTYTETEVSSENFWAMAGILLGGIFSAYVSSLILYGIGDAIENIACIKEKFASDTHISTSSKAYSYETVSETKTVREDKDGWWNCASCGALNRPSATKCCDCGQEKQ